MRSSWGETVANILRDCEPECRLEFMARLAMWKRMSQQRVDKGDEPHPGDFFAAQDRLIKLQALEEHLEKALDFDASMRAALRRLDA